MKWKKRCPCLWGELGETDASEAEVWETEARETRGEAEVRETEARETETKAWETEIPETNVQETNAPETEATEAQTGFVEQESGTAAWPDTEIPTEADTEPVLETEAALETESASKWEQGEEWIIGAEEASVSGEETEGWEEAGVMAAFYFDEESQFYYTLLSDGTAQITGDAWEKTGGFDHTE